MPFALLLGVLAGGLLFRKRPLVAKPKPKPKQQSGGKDAGIAAATVAGAIVGAVAGGAIDTAIGGTDPTEHVVAEIGGASIGVAAVLAAAGVISFPVAAVVIGVAVLAYGVGAVISDIARLSYGQAGAIRDYDSNWQLTHDMAFGQYIGKSDNHTEREVTPFVDGYCLQLNDIAYAKWSKVPKNPEENLGVFSHDQWGADRGYYVAGGNVYIRCANPDWVAQWVPIGEQGSLTVQMIAANPLTASAVGSGELVGSAKTSLGAKDRTVTTIHVPTDKNAQKFIGEGRIAANTKAYVDWCKTAPAIDGLHSGQFLGSVNGDGRLTFLGATVDFRDFKGK